ncbi:tail fiber protein [Christensenella hongkongensis]|nr:tail fiber protein [Christensenella hongkongensis]TCW27236.1 microcystin-dependent protein [Christensenella hongkongensis]
MNIDKLKFTDADFNGQDVSSLPDNPSAEGISASELKERFDNIGKMMIALGKHNELIDALMDTEAGKSGAENIGVSTIFGAEGTNVQDVLESVRRLEVEDKAELLQKFNEYVAKTDIVQMRGRSTTAVMSQKAVTDAIDAGGGGGGGGGEFEPVGCMKFFAGETLPDGYLWCDGASYPTNGDYKTLFEIIGTRYNQADDMANTFRVPDMRGRVGVGKDEDTFDTLGKAGGSETQSYDLTNGTATAQMLVHNGQMRSAFNGSVIEFTNQMNITNSASVGPVAGYGVKVVGSTAPENNLQPYLVCNYIIKYDRSYEEIGVTAPPCIWAFSDSDWQENEAGGYVLNIPEREHRRGEHCVLTALYDTTETDKMKAVLFEMEKNSAGDIVIYSDTTFEGTAYIDRVYLVPAGRVLSVNGKTPDMDGDVPVVEGDNQNLIINGDFQVWQRGESNFTGGGYTADRWRFDSANSDNSATVARNNGKRQCAIIATQALNNNARISQYVEVAKNFGDYLNGKTLTLSFEAYTPTPRTITAYVGKGPVSTDSIATKEFSLDSQEQRLSMTFDIPEGTFSSEDGYLYVIIGLATNTAGTYGFSRPTVFSAGCLEIGQVKLEYGNVATPFVHRMYQEELALCERYYQVLPSDLNGAIAYTPTNANVYVKFTAPMRSVPAITGVSSWYIAYNGGILDKLTIQEIYARGNTGMAFTLGTFASKPAQAVCAWGNNALMKLDAEIY